MTLAFLRAGASTGDGGDDGWQHEARGLAPDSVPPGRDLVVAPLSLSLCLAVDAVDTIWHIHRGPRPGATEEPLILGGFWPKALGTGRASPDGMGQDRKATMLVAGTSAKGRLKGSV